MAFRTVAAIYDIHGNLPALEAVLAEIREIGVDAIVVGGDVAWGPDPVGVLDRLLHCGQNLYFIRGNTDRELAAENHTGLGQSPHAEITWWCAQQLSAEQKRFLADLPERATVDIAGLGPVLFVHGSPRSDVEAIRINTPDSEIEPMLEGVSEPVIVCGHTHIQFDRMVAGKRIVNAGSVGLQIRARGACWALLGPSVDLRETAYDYEAAAEHIRASGVPMAADFADHILHPPLDGP